MTSAPKSPHVSRLSPETKIEGVAGSTLGEFWSWAYSDTLSNVNRSVFGEFVVAKALGIATGIRIEWNAYDLDYDGHRIEVKTSGYCQTWRQEGHSKIVFDIAEKSSWFADSKTQSDMPVRAADIYIFALHAEKDWLRANSSDVNQWAFYVVSKERIEAKLGKQKSISLESLIKSLELTALRFADLKYQVDELRRTIPRRVAGKLESPS